MICNICLSKYDTIELNLLNPTPNHLKQYVCKTCSMWVLQNARILVEHNWISMINVISDEVDIDALTQCIGGFMDYHNERTVHIEIDWNNFFGMLDYRSFYMEV